jgi:high-affinity iron transporter
MGAAFLITLREGLEAALIVAIVMAYLRQLGRREQFGVVAGGAIAGAAMALAVGVGVYLTIGELEGSAEGYMEAVIALAAAGVLTWMIFWMRNQARSIGGHLRGEVDRALATGAVLGLASITFIGVLREGIETALFMLAVVFDSGVVSSSVGGFAGLSVAFALGYAIYRGGQYVNLRMFFQVTGGLVIIFAAGLFGKGIFQLQVLGVFESYHFPVWDLTATPLLGKGQVAAFLRGIFGWSARPSIEQVVIWIAFIGTAGWFFYYGRLPASVSARLDQWLNALARPFMPLVSRTMVTESEDIAAQDR